MTDSESSILTRARAIASTHGALMGQFGGVSQSGINIGGGERRITAENFLVGDTGGEVIEYYRHHDTCAFNARLTVTDSRIDTDTLK